MGISSTGTTLPVEQPVWGRLVAAWMVPSMVADIVLYMQIIYFSCISLDLSFNFTDDWLCYQKSYNEIEARMTKEDGPSELYGDGCRSCLAPMVTITTAKRT
jgi:hypothetical protein